MNRWLQVVGDFPWPTWHGGRLEAHNRLLASARAGVEVDLIATVKQTPTAEHIEYLLGLVGNVWIEQRRHPLAAAARICRPFQLSSRQVRPATVAAVEAAHSRRPYDLVLADGLYTIDIARRMARRLGVPLVLRSHNVESRYYAGQAAGAGRPLLAAAFRVEQWRMARLERSSRLSRSVAININIAAEDEQAHRRTMACPQAYVPPFLARAQTGGSAVKPPSSADVLFIGSLFLPQAHTAVQWFVDQVWPLVLTLRPDATFLVVGRGAPEEMAAAWRACAGVEVVGEVPDVAPWYDQARVVVNPVARGSGVNMKNLEALAADRPLVTTTCGARGPSWRDDVQLDITDNPADFAAAVVRLLDDDQHWSKRVAASRCFLRDELDPDRAFVYFRSLLSDLSR